MVITTYPDLLDAERLRERGCDITAKRIRYFQRFAGAPWHMPALNDQPVHDARCQLPNGDSAAASIIVPFHKLGDN